MKRWLYVSRTVHGDAGEVAHALAGAARGLLQTGGPADVRADGSFPARVAVEGTPFSRVLEVSLGVVARRSDGRHVLPIVWKADAAEAAFPQFDGSIEAEPLSGPATRLNLVGSYVPPLGPLGLALDAAGLGRIAEATARSILDRLADGLGTKVEPLERQTKSITVGDVMTRDPITIDPDLPVRSAALLLFHFDVTGAPVISQNGDLLGVLTERDLLDKEAPRPYGFRRSVNEAWRRREAMTAGDACSKPALVTAPGVSLHEAVGEMLRAGVRRLVVVEGGRVVGIVTRHDVVGALLRTDEELQHAVDAALAATDERHVVATVEWGSVVLRGKVSRRSRVQEVAAVVRAVDGIMSVDHEELIWDVDDVAILGPAVSD